MAIGRQRLGWLLPWRRQGYPRTAEARPRVSDAIVDAPVDFNPNDPLLYYLQQAGGVVDVDALQLESPGLEALRAAGVKLVLPLVSQGELIGTVNLGPRLSEQEYSSDDRRLLADLAGQAAPAVRLAQLARQQQAEARERERLVQELKVARLIQRTLLPKALPDLSGWGITVHYQPARAVGGDFYDFFTLADGRLGVLVGDVTDKGVPAALVMATTRAILRGAAARHASPGAILEETNELLFQDIPPKMFVTCLCAVLDPAGGRLTYANAGHDLPYRRSAEGTSELRATGMPLGLMPGMRYEEREVTLEPGDSVLFYSDGLVEAHDPQRRMFGFDRLQELMGRHPGDESLIPFLLDELSAFVGAAWEQEDDVTLLVLRREAEQHDAPSAVSEGYAGLTSFTVASRAGQERVAVARMVEALERSELTWRPSPARLERLKTATAETVMNAIEHGNGGRREVPVEVEVLGGPQGLLVKVRDQGAGRPQEAREAPDLEAKLAGLQSPRGWGLFLVEKMVDEVRVVAGPGSHTVELMLHREEG